MTDRRPALPPTFVALALLVLGALLPACSRSGPPSLDDVGYWRTQFANGESIEDVVSQGTAALPLLRRLLADGNEAVVQNAAVATQQIGEPAASLLPTMLEALGRFPNQPFVVQAIKAMKGSGVEYLVPLVESGNAASQALGVELLNGIGTAAGPAVEPLMKIIEGQAPTDLKRAALVTLGSIGVPAEPVIMRLNTFALANEDLRQDAAMSIKRIRTARKVELKGGNR